MIATLLWMLVSGPVVVWMCSLVSCPTPPGYVGQHRYTGDHKQWLVYGLSEGFISQIKTWNGEDGESTSEEARDVLAKERISRWQRAQDSEASEFGVTSGEVAVPPRGPEYGPQDQSIPGVRESVEASLPGRKTVVGRSSLVVYAQPFYLGDDYPAADFRRVLVDHLLTGGGRDPVFANA